MKCHNEVKFAEWMFTNNFLSLPFFHRVEDQQLRGSRPSVYQSADHLKTGPITKRGSPHLRRIMVEVAQAAVKTKNSRSRSFFLRLKMKKGYNKSIVAVARKIL
jgi:transposase